MPLYYFDVVDDEQSVADEWGIELADDLEASEQALSLLPDIARNRLPRGDRRDISVLVRCGGGEPCFRATLIIRSEWSEPARLPPG
ncbi:MAG: DUF6894 family protein [Janthinobacterium lividum]